MEVEPDAKTAEGLSKITLESVKLAPGEFDIHSCAALLQIVGRTPVVGWMHSWM